MWIYAIFLFTVYENKNLKEVNLSDKLQCPHCQQLSSRVEVESKLLK